MWPHKNVFFAAMGGGGWFHPDGAITAPEQIADRVGDFPIVGMALAPLMHGACWWYACIQLLAGNTVVLNPARSLVGEESGILWPGRRSTPLPSSAMPWQCRLLDALDANTGRWDLSSIFSVGSGGAVFSDSKQEAFREHFPNVFITNSFGSSESGNMGMDGGGKKGQGLGNVTKSEFMSVITDDEGEPHRHVAPGEMGIFARSGYIPVGYYNDPVKTAKTIVEVDGKPWLLLGDEAQLEDDNSITVFGRGSNCINTGGEKVFPEEVEQALKAHPDIFDCLVVGTPDERFGSKVSGCSVSSRRRDTDAGRRCRKTRASTLQDTNCRGSCTLSTRCRGRPVASPPIPRRLKSLWRASIECRRLRPLMNGSRHMAELDISTKNCIVEQDGHLLIVTLNRPEAKNAFSPEMLLGMYKAWRLLEEDDELYCAILTANGDTFCAGMDLKAGAEGAATFHRRVYGSYGPGAECALAGIAAGQPAQQTADPGGRGLCAGRGHRDTAGYRYSRGGRECYFRGHRGGAGPVSHVRLHRASAPADSLLCRRRNAAVWGAHHCSGERWRSALINRIVPAGQTLAAAREYAAKICANGPLAVKAVIRSLREHQECMAEEEAMVASDELAGPVFASADAKEGMRAFKEKRPAKFSGK